MEERLILDTSFLVDLLRERRRRATGPATHFLLEHEGTTFLMCTTVAGEFAVGFASSQRETFEAEIAPFPVLEWRPSIVWEYSRACRYLQGIGQLIGTNDLWVAATALAYKLPVLTGNAQHFRRVPGLEVISYGATPE